MMRGGGVPGCAPRRGGDALLDVVRRGGGARMLKRVQQQWQVRRVLGEQRRLERVVSGACGGAELAQLACE